LWHEAHATTITATPSPSPQGGGEPIQFAARSYARIAPLVFRGINAAAWFLGGGFALYAVAAWSSSVVTAELDPDGLGYVYPAVSALSGEPFEPAEMRNFVYPLLVRAALGQTDSAFSLIHLRS
jgi:hypothetical protein